jgi:predicted nucleic acid-binding protein
MAAATTVVDRWFIDTNILVYAGLTLHPLNAAALGRLRALEAAGVELWVSRQTFREYLSAMIRPGQYTGVIPVASLVADVQRFEQGYWVAEDTAAVTANLLALVSSVQTGGKRVYDANIVATMQHYGIPNLLTNNTADFARFAGLITVVPLVP